MIGFIITAVGIPIMGVAAIGNTHSDGLQQLSNKVGKGYGYVFSCLLYLTIGPGFAIPRCATTSFTVGVAPMLSAGASGVHCAADLLRDLLRHRADFVPAPRRDHRLDW